MSEREREQRVWLLCVAAVGGVQVWEVAVDSVKELLSEWEDDEERTRRELRALLTNSRHLLTNSSVAIAGCDAVRV